MHNYYLAVDIGASSGRHMLGHLENGKMVLEEIYRFENGMTKQDGRHGSEVYKIMPERHNRDTLPGGGERASAFSLQPLTRSSGTPRWIMWRYMRISVWYLLSVIIRRWRFRRIGGRRHCGIKK